jgi:hypothetical protein
VAIERQAPANKVMTFGYGTIRRFFARHAITRKKDRACGRVGPTRHSDAARSLVRSQLDLDPERLVFLDETWASTKMARSHGRCRERLRIGGPHGHWKTTTFVAGLTRAASLPPLSRKRTDFFSSLLEDARAVADGSNAPRTVRAVCGTRCGTEIHINL